MLRLPRQHLPLADGRGASCASWSPRPGSTDAHRGRQRRHRRLARRATRRTPRSRGGGCARAASTLTGVARQFSAPTTSTRFDYVLAMDRANARDLRALAPDAQAARARCACCAASTRTPRQRPRRARPVLRRRRRLRRRARRWRRRLPRPARAPAPRARPVTAGRRARLAGARRDRARAPVARRRHQRRLPRGPRRRPRAVREAPRRRRAGMFASEARGLRLARRGRARCACPRVIAVRTSAGVPRARVDRAAARGAGHDERPRPRPGGAAPRRRAAASASTTTTTSAACRRRNAPAAELAGVLRRARRLEPLVAQAVDAGAGSPPGACARSSACSPASPELCGPRRAAGAPARRPVGRQRHGRRARAPGADRPGRLRRPPRDRPGDDAAVRRLRRARASPPTTRRHPLAAATRSASQLYQLYPLLVHAVLFGGGYAGSAERVMRRYAG